MLFTCERDETALNITSSVSVSVLCRVHVEPVCLPMCLQLAHTISYLFINFNVNLSAACVCWRGGCVHHIVHFCVSYVLCVCVCVLCGRYVKPLGSDFSFHRLRNIIRLIATERNEKGGHKTETQNTCSFNSC